MRFLRSVFSFTIAFILAFILAFLLFMHFSTKPPIVDTGKLNEQFWTQEIFSGKSTEPSPEKLLYVEYMELSPVERMGKKELLSKAAHGDYLPAIRQMAIEAEEGRVPEGMIEKEYNFWMKKAADLGDPEGQHETFFHNNMSNAERFKYLSKATEQNYGPSLLTLGRIYAEGDKDYGISRNEGKAIECYRRAAKANEQDALYLMYLLARLHVLPEEETAQLNERYREEAKQAEDGISPSFGSLENLEESEHALQLLTTYLPANEKVKAFQKRERNSDPFK